MKRIAHEFTQHNTAPRHMVFPLLCPVREAEWVPGWKYRLVYSKYGLAEQGCVFTTPGDDGREITWIITHYDATANEIRFTWVWPEMIATIVEIKLTDAPDRSTLTNVRYTYTALTPDGERELDRYDQAWFENKMKGWETAINHFLATGRCIDESHLAQGSSK